MKEETPQDKIVGYTKSKKPIYDVDAHHPDPEWKHLYSDFTRNDHADAAIVLLAQGHNPETELNKKKAYGFAASCHERHVVNCDWIEAHPKGR
jgi:hypothetical protein